MAENSDQVADAYAAPAANAEYEAEDYEADQDTDSERGYYDSPRFYTVPIPTLVIWHLVTFGLYPLYWFYQHWSVQRRWLSRPISPLGRSFFSIFFVHRLFRTIDQGARDAGMSPRWQPGSQASLYVLVVLVARVAGQLGSDESDVSWLSVLLGLASCLPLIAAQRVANLANAQVASLDEGDDDEERDDDEEQGED